MLEPVIKTIDVPCNQEQAFNVFIEEITTWWPLDKNSVSAMGGGVAKAVSIEPKVGGKIVEIGHDDTEHFWGTVNSYEPHSAFSLNWHIGLPAESASLVAVSFTSIDDGKTRVELTHSNWEAFGDQAADMRAGYEGGWVGVFETAYHAACQ